MMIQSFWEILATVSKFFDLVRVALWESTFLSISVPSVCAMFRSSEESKILSEFKNHFCFLPFQCDGMNKTEKKSKNPVCFKNK